MEDMQKRLASCAVSSSPPMVDEIKEGTFWTCRFDPDGHWYRVRVTKSASEDRNQRAQVHFVDYGNSTLASVSNLRPLPCHLATLPACAHRMALSSVAPRGVGGEWDREAIEFFVAHTGFDAVFEARRKGRRDLGSDIVLRHPLTQIYESVTNAGSAALSQTTNAHPPVAWSLISLAHLVAPHATQNPTFCDNDGSDKLGRLVGSHCETQLHPVVAGESGLLPRRRNGGADPTPEDLLHCHRPRHLIILCQRAQVHFVDYGNSTLASVSNLRPLPCHLATLPACAHRMALSSVAPRGVGGEWDREAIEFFVAHTGFDAVFEARRKGRRDLGSDIVLRHPLTQIYESVTNAGSAALSQTTNAHPPVAWSLISLAHLVAPHATQNPTFCDNDGSDKLGLLVGSHCETQLHPVVAGESGLLPRRRNGGADPTPEDLLHCHRPRHLIILCQRAQVHFVDYGNSTLASVSNLRPLPCHLATLPACAHRMALSSVAPRGVGGEWDREAIEFFVAHTGFDAVFEARRKGRRDLGSDIVLRHPLTQIYESVTNAGSAALSQTTNAHPPVAWSLISLAHLVAPHATQNPTFCDNDGSDKLGLLVGSHCETQLHPVVAGESGLLPRRRNGGADPTPEDLLHCHRPRHLIILCQRAQVHFVDYGNSTLASVSNLRPLPCHLATLPACAHRMALSSVAPRGVGGEWDREAIEFFVAHTGFDAVFEARRKGRRDLGSDIVLRHPLTQIYESVTNAGSAALSQTTNAHPPVAWSLISLAHLVAPHATQNPTFCDNDGSDKLGLLVGSHCETQLHPVVAGESGLLPRRRNGGADPTPEDLLHCHRPRHLIILCQRAQVHFVDYGNSTLASVSNLRPLPCHLATLPACAHRMALSSVAPRGVGGEWDREAIEFFVAHTGFDAVFEARRKGRRDLGSDIVLRHPLTQIYESVTNAGSAALSQTTNAHPPVAWSLISLAHLVAPHATQNPTFCDNDGSDKLGLLVGSHCETQLHPVVAGESGLLPRRRNGGADPTPEDLLHCHRPRHLIILCQRAQVHFVDYGNSTLASVSNLRPLPCHLATLPACAHRMALSSVAPRGVGGEWDREAIEFFVAHTGFDAVFEARRKGRRDLGSDIVLRHPLTQIYESVTNAGSAALSQTTNAHPPVAWSLISLAHLVAPHATQNPTFCDNDGSDKLGLLVGSHCETQLHPVVAGESGLLPRRRNGGADPTPEDLLHCHRPRHLIILCQRAQVHFVDYGNSTLASVSNLRPLPCHLATLPACAHRMALSSVAPRGVGGEWDREAIEFFVAHTGFDAVFEARRKGRRDLGSDIVLRHPLTQIYESVTNAGSAALSQTTNAHPPVAWSLISLAHLVAPHATQNPTFCDNDGSDKLGLLVGSHCETQLHPVVAGESGLLPRRRNGGADPTPEDLLHCHRPRHLIILCQRAQVHFVDYGNSTLASVSNLRPLPCHLATLPACAHRMALSSVAPRGVGGEWDREAIEFFVAHTGFDAVFEARRKGRRDLG
ncbi:uncharacterized protein LOC144174046 [Haemaphysalis longicornis]